MPGRLPNPDRVPGVIMVPLPALSSFLAGYLHQDWDLEYEYASAATASFASNELVDVVLGVLGELAMVNAALLEESAVETILGWLEAIKRFAVQLGIGVESLRRWVKQREIDDGVRPGMTSAEAARIKELKQEVREHRRANADPQAGLGFSRRRHPIRRSCQARVGVRWLQAVCSS
jgi:transposase-like protein